MIEVYPELLLEAWGVQQAFATMGFDVDDLYLLFATNAVDNRPSVFIALKRKEEVEYTVLCGSLSAKEDVVQTQWSAFVDEANAMEHREFEALLSCSRVMGNVRNFQALAMGLITRGIIPPELEG